MKPKPFAVLAIVTVLALAAALASYTTQNRWSQAKVSGTSLFPGLAADLAKVARIEISQDDKSLALVRDKESWSLADRGYPARTEPVRTLLVKLAQAELVDGKTRNKERYAQLELEDPAAKGAKSRLVRLLDDKGSVLAAAIVGKKRFDAFGATKGGTYVRKPGDEQTWLSNAELDLPVAVRDWVQAGLVNLDADKIAKVTVEIPGEEPLVIERDAAKKHAVTGLTVPEGKKPKDGAGEEIVRAAGSLDLEDVRKPATTGEDAGVAKVEADGGLGLTLRLRKEGEAYWLTVEASGGDGDAKKTADEITKRTQGWQFKIPTGKAQSILKRRADLLQAS